jgi:hypothetical protein
MEAVNSYETSVQICETYMMPKPRNNIVWIIPTVEAKKLILPSQKI